MRGEQILDRHQNGVDFCGVLKRFAESPSLVKVNSKLMGDFVLLHLLGTADTLRQNLVLTVLTRTAGAIKLYTFI